MASLGAALAVSFLLTRREGFGLLLWWAAMAACGAVTLLAFEPLARRAVTLATLLDLSLVFPSKAPSRAFIALRASRYRRLQIRLIQTSMHDGNPNSRMAERMALASALGVLRQQRRGQTSRARATGGAFVVAAALITSTVLIAAPTQAPPGHRPAGPAVAAPGPVEGLAPSPARPGETEPSTSPTPTPVAESSNQVAHPTIPDDTRGDSKPPVAESSTRAADPTISGDTRDDSKPPEAAPSSSSLAPALSAETGGASAPGEGPGPSPANVAGAAQRRAAVPLTTQPLAIVSDQSPRRPATEPNLPAPAQIPSPLRAQGAVTERRVEPTSRTKAAPKGDTGEEGGRSEAGNSVPAAPPNRTVTSGAKDSAHQDDRCGGTP
jgi:hypothetical protein